MASCSPPRSQGVKAHVRSKPRRKPRRKPAAYHVIDTRSGRAVSSHRTWSAAVNERKRRDLQAYRAGRGRPYEVRRAS